LDRFAELGAATDLQMEFSEPKEQTSPEPPPASTPLPPSWTAQPPRMFQAGEPEPPRRRRLKLTAALLIFVAICFAGGYAWRRRSSRTAPATPIAASKPPVTSTTVDLPPAAAATEAQKAPAPATAPHTSESTRPAPPPPRATSSATNAPQKQSAKGQGRLLIRSTPADAIVIVNGDARGKTPLTVRDLPFGSYTIHLARDGYAAADRRLRLTAKRPSASVVVGLKRTASKGPAASERSESMVRQGSPSTLSLPNGSRGSVSVQSRPAGARVFMNNRLIGATPLAIPDLPAGPAAVRIEMDGYQTWATTVQVNAGQRTTVTASLDRK